MLKGGLRPKAVITRPTWDSLKPPDSGLWRFLKMNRELMPLTANNGRSAQTKTAPEGAAIDYFLYDYASFRLATPIKPMRPEPNSHTAAGTGTALTFKSSKAREVIVPSND